MKESIKVTVVMAVYNAEGSVTKAIEGILQQSFRDFEFIIIDDGSIDGTLAILDEYSKKDNRIILLRQPKRGLTCCLNRALEISRGQYILRQDADDISLPGRIKSQLEYIEKNQLDVVSSYAYMVNKQAAVLKILKSPLGHNALVRALQRYNCILHPTVMFRKKAALSIAGFNEHFKFAQDYDFYLRGILNGFRFGVIPEPLVKMAFNPLGLTVRNRRQQLLFAVSAQARYFAAQDTFRLIYVIYILNHIFKIIIPLFIRNLRIWGRNKKS